MTEKDFYAQFAVKRYKHWILQVEEKQRYLGQAVVWLRREGDMQRLSSLSRTERNELWDKVLPEYEKALVSLWKPNHLNYAWLGNYFHLHKGHGHLHIMPRYKSSRRFAGTVFKDDRWGKNYVPYADNEKTIKVAHAVRAALANKIPGSI